MCVCVCLCVCVIRWNFLMYVPFIVLLAFWAHVCFYFIIFFYLFIFFWRGVGGRGAVKNLISYVVYVAMLGGYCLLDFACSFLGTISSCILIHRCLTYRIDHSGLSTMLRCLQRFFVSIFCLTCDTSKTFGNNDRRCRLWRERQCLGIMKYCAVDWGI